MNSEQQVAAAIRYLRSKGYKVGSGRIFDAVIKIITDPNVPAEDVRALDRVIRSEQADVLLELMFRDIAKSHKAPKRKVRRGVGSY